MNFQTGVSFIAVIFLILTLTSLAIVLKKTNRKSTFPDIISQCPETYELKGDSCIDANGNVLTIENKTNITDINNLDLEVKRQYTDDNKIVWDGISNAPKDKGEDDKTKNSKWSNSFKLDRRYFILILLLVLLFYYFFNY